DSGRGGPGIGVDPTGEGDVTKTHRRWTIPQVPEGFSSPVVVVEHLYRLHGPGILKCWKLATGEQVYSERLQGVSTASSPIVTPEGHIYCASAGTSYVIKAGERFDVLARNELGEGGPASPAVAAGKLYLKGGKYLWCIGTK